MCNETCGKLLFKVASQDKVVGFMANLLLLKKQADSAERKAEVQTKVASIIESTLHKKKDS